MSSPLLTSASHPRSLLLKEALEEITKTKRQRYEDWRRSQLGGFRLGRKIRRVLLLTVVPAVVCLQVCGGASCEELP